MHSNNNNEKVLYNLKIDNDDDKYSKNRCLCSKKLLLLTVFIILVAAILIFSFQYLWINTEANTEVITEVINTKIPVKYPQILSGREHPENNICDWQHYKWIYYSSDKNSLYLCTEEDGWLYMSKLFRFEKN